MIPYEELERALARWKARRAGTVEVLEPPPEGDRTPPAPLIAQSAGYTSAQYDVKDTTSELELSDAEVHEEH